MRKILILPIVTLGLTALIPSPALAKFHWNARCQKVHIKGYKLRKGTDCAHVLTKGKTWKFTNR